MICKNLLVLAAGLSTMLLSDVVSAQEPAGVDRWSQILTRIACESVGRFKHCRLLGSEKDDLAKGVVRTQYHLKVGPGEFDTITIHRVSTTYPDRRPKAVMLLPGTGLDVENVYLPGLNSNAVAREFSPLVLMARSGIDAWSADYRGSDLPPGLEDFSFMVDWGLRTATADMQLAIRFSRLVRLFSGDGYRRIIVGGYSAGVSVAFAVASADAIRHRSRRDVGGIIGIDDAFDVEPGTAASETACDDLTYIDEDIANGIFSENLSFLNIAGNLARNAPDDLSPFGMPPEFVPTNLEFLNFVAVLPAGPDSTFHLFGGQFDDTGAPFPVFTPQQLLIDQATLIEPALPIQFSRDLAEIRCSDQPVSELDGGLGNVRVPVLHIGAAGGNANAIDYTLSQLGSRDITTIVVQVLPQELAMFDYGHADVFAATDADVRVWQPMIEWVNAH